MTETFLGRWTPPPTPALSSVEVEVLPIDLLSEWSRCGATADFLAAYLGAAYAAREVAVNVLSTIANELVENAAKFAADDRSAIRVSIVRYGTEVHVETASVTSADRAAELAARLEQLERERPRDVVVRGLSAGGHVGVGLAMLASDYRAAIGAAVSDGPTAALRRVRVRAAIPAAEVEVEQP